MASAVSPAEPLEGAEATWNAGEGFIGSYDAAIVGTSLSSSILAAALSKAGKKVVHLDENEYYGSKDASLALHELVEWAGRHHGPHAHLPDYRSVRRGFQTTSALGHLPEELQRVSRQYALSLAPSLIPATGDFIDALVCSGVSKYTSFRLLESIALGSGEGDFRQVPTSKEDVFKSEVLDLPAKRRLMKFLLFAAGDFEGSDIFQRHSAEAYPEFMKDCFALDSSAIAAVGSAVALANTYSETAASLLPRLRSYLRSSGRYGNSPFLIGHYGGLGELAQGFCRASAVHGGIYILGKKVTGIGRHVSPSTTGTGCRLAAGDLRMTAMHVVMDAAAARSALGVSCKSHDVAVHRAIVVLDGLVSTTRPSTTKQEDAAGVQTPRVPPETILIVFEPALCQSKDGEDLDGVSLRISGVDTDVDGWKTWLLEELSQFGPVKDVSWGPRSNLPRDVVQVSTVRSPSESFLATPLFQVLPSGEQRRLTVELDAQSRTKPVQALIVGEGTGSCPFGQCVIYLSTAGWSELPSEDVLRPFLDRLLAQSSVSANIIFDLFYQETFPTLQGQNQSMPNVLISQRAPVGLAETADDALKEAHRVLKLIMGDEAGTDLFMPSEAGQDDDDL